MTYSTIDPQKRAAKSCPRTSGLSALKMARALGLRGEDKHPPPFKRRYVLSAPSSTPLSAPPRRLHRSKRSEAAIPEKPIIREAMGFGCMSGAGCPTKKEASDTTGHNAVRKPDHDHRETEPRRDDRRGREAASGPEAWDPIFKAFPELTVEQLEQKFRKKAEAAFEEAGVRAAICGAQHSRRSSVIPEIVLTAFHQPDAIRGATPAVGGDRTKAHGRSSGCVWSPADRRG